MTENLTEETSWNILDRRDEMMSCNIKMGLMEWFILKLASCPLEDFEVFSFRAAIAELVLITFFFFGATAPILDLAYLHETLRFTSFSRS
jgi:hypothetical protein